MAAKHVARELVEQQHRGERLVGRAEEMLGHVLALLVPERLEPLPDLCVEFGIGLPPIVPAAREPEGKDRLDLILVHAAVPPTVIPSINRVGWPTPAGTDWPPLPQMPIPSSSAM